MTGKTETKFRVSIGGLYPVTGRRFDEVVGVRASFKTARKLALSRLRELVGDWQTSWEPDKTWDNTDSRGRRRVTYFANRRLKFDPPKPAPLVIEVQDVFSASIQEVLR